MENPTIMKFTPGNDLTHPVIGCAIEVHRNLGPGLLESVYEACLCDELTSIGLTFVRQRSLPVFYKGKTLDGHYQMDILVEGALVIEVKAVHQLLPIHEAQLQTYLCLSGSPLGLLMNFNTTQMKDGIRRVIAPKAASYYIR
jgi:GxxExxY protein